MKKIFVKTEDEAISLIDKYGAWILRRMPNFWNNKRVVLNAVKKDGFLLEVASSSLKKDIEIVYWSILTFPRAILFADEQLSKNQTLRKLAFKINGKPFIANKKAFNHFKIHDDKMIKGTTRIVKKINGDEELIFDENKIIKSLIYRKLHKLYKGQASLEDILKYENGLENRMFSKNVIYAKEHKQTIKI